MTTLNLSIYQLYLYLANATLCVPETYRDQIFQDMAYKLLEWDGVPIQELRDVFDKLGMKLKEFCRECGSEVDDKCKDCPAQ